jgi:hypothetical protein
LKGKIMILQLIGAIFNGIGQALQTFSGGDPSLRNALTRDRDTATNTNTAFQTASLIPQPPGEQVAEERREDRDRVAQQQQAQQQQAQQQRQLQWNQDVALLEQSGTPTIYQT